MNEVSNNRQVLLLSMPFAPIKWPSLALSSLKASLAGRGIDAEVDYLGFNAAELFGPDFFNFVAEETYSTLLGEWIFSDSLFGNAWGNDADYVGNVLRPNLAGRTNIPLPEHEFVRDALTAKEKAETFIDSCFASRDWSQYRIIGFTTTFQQNVASLALAKRIKHDFPNILIVFGGANCEGEMGVGLLSGFDCIDYVFSGESEDTFPAFASEILDGRAPEPRKGLIARDPETGLVPQQYRSSNWVSPIDNLDRLPIPDHSDYFNKLEVFEHILPRSCVNMSFETSRGCWWGRKNHCTFCGLNPHSMSFRAKSPDRALEELLALQEAYPCDFWQVTDDIIALPYFKTFLPALAQANPGVRLFYETKANLTKDQLKILKSANVSHIQPGIESLSENVLKLMNKGISPLQNVRLLKWCQEIGLTPPWNLIWGFPGETSDDYLEQTRLAHLISHLEPPSYFGRIRLDRFSPHFDRSNDFGFSNLRPSKQHDYVYNLESNFLSMIAYTFDYDLPTGQLDESAIDELRSAVHTWQSSWHQSDLILLDKNGIRRVIDTRPGFGIQITSIDEVDYQLLMLLDPITSISKLLDAISCDQNELHARLDRFDQRGWIAKSSSQIISTVVLSNTIKSAALDLLKAAQDLNAA